jgi:hypothetical protein
MTEEEKQTRNSKLVATIITHLNNKNTILITPGAKYTLEDGRLIIAPESVENYNTAVKKEIDKITQRAQAPMNNILGKEEYFIQIYGSALDIKLS